MKYLLFLNQKQEEFSPERINMRNWQRLLEQFLKLKPSIQLVLALCFLVLIIGVISIIIIVGFNPIAGPVITTFIAGILVLFTRGGRTPRSGG